MLFPLGSAGLVSVQTILNHHASTAVRLECLLSAQKHDFSVSAGSGPFLHTRFRHGQRARLDIALLIKSNIWPPITSGDIHPRLCRGRPKGTTTSAALVDEIDGRLTSPCSRIRLVDLSTLLAAWPWLPAPTSRPRQHLVDNGCIQRRSPPCSRPSCTWN